MWCDSLRLTIIQRDLQDGLLHEANSILLGRSIDGDLMRGPPGSLGWEVIL